jgi:hypothetical protein
MHRWFRIQTARIARNELAARHRVARFPAARCVGVLQRTPPVPHDTLLTLCLDPRQSASRDVIREIRGNPRPVM